MFEAVAGDGVTSAAGGELAEQGVVFHPASALAPMLLPRHKPTGRPAHQLGEDADTGCAHHDPNATLNKKATVPKQKNLVAKKWPG